MRPSGDIGRQQASYQRGLVLGLTVAESMLLILFALLLALGWTLVKRDQQAAKLQADQARLTEAARLLEAKIEVLDALARNQPPDTFFQELVRARDAQAAIAAERQRIAAREKAASKLEEVLAEVEAAPDARKRLAELAAAGKRLEDALAQSPAPPSQADPYEYIAEGVDLAAAAAEAGQSPEETRAILRDGARAAREKATLKGQVTRLQKELRSVGKGGDYPPCWVTEAGDIEYLFDIALNSDGTLTVKDAAPPLRVADRRNLPIPPQLYGSVGRAQFLQLTSALLAHENGKGCRFYVIARDRTGPTQKDLFKNLLINTVEARFYKSIRP